ncbi:condensin complex subunit 2-like isoform X2 [Prosopis cineraria]|uniref:condensin complex subunit 2-like isoform X2 n=1 Tax=Prosopis cineraria TaxID=364024 RepID=UPI00240F580B|nr:condensin complex subunit 2-like isoform X2 [Prosopis cineraria]
MTGGAAAPLPSTAPRHRRALMANRFQSPTTPFFLGSNDDQFERAQSRAARATSIRCKVAATPPPADPGLSNDQIVELFSNCIKLACENKITQKNSWQLKLIDHLNEVVKVDAENDAETNFQKASCTLEAGVKIYSARVDAVHSEAYKVLTRMKQTGAEYEQDITTEVDHINGSKGKCHSQPGSDSDKKLSPLATLESSFEPLNVKKFDVAFMVDPLYHQTSLLFDEGEVKGLLLNNLGIYGGCCVLFDSFDVPGKYKSYLNHIDTSEKIDLSFAEESIEQMVMKMATTTNISPTLEDIFRQLDEYNHRSLSTDNLSQAPEQRADAFSAKDPNFDSGILGNHYANLDDLDETAAVNERSSSLDSNFQGFLEDNDSCAFYRANMDGSHEPVPMFLLQVLGNTSKQNAWAGPDHWKYWKYWRFKSPEDDPGSECEPNLTTKKSRNKSTVDIDIEFMEFLDKEMPDIFSPPQNPKSTLLAANRKPPDNKLQEDCHYQPQDIVRQFLHPIVVFSGKRRKKPSVENFWRQNSSLGPPWEHQSVSADHYDDIHVYSDGEVNDRFISQPCQVKETEIQYEKTTKQVDVHALKESLWHHMQDSRESTESVHDGAVSFKCLLASVPIDCSAAVEAGDISPHMCFICLLHLANEHGLVINDCPDLDDLIIGFLS